MTMRTVQYKNARIVDCESDFTGSVYVRGDRIAFVGGADEFPCNETVDVGGKTLMPAFVDLHTHLRDPGFPQKETMETGMRAALKGGYAAVCAMANTNPIIETPRQVLDNLERAKSLRLVRLVQSAAAGVGLKDETPTDYAALARVTRVLTNDGNTIFSDDFMRALLIASKRYGFLISTHCQPERKTVARDIALLREVGGNLHIGHISTAETVEMVRSAKAEGLKLTCEVTPHHLFGWDCDYRVNPPLRTRADVEALIEGVRDGTIDALATDHAPHTPEDKKSGMAGISNIEYAARVYWQVFYENDIPLTRFSEMASYTPSRLLGLEGGRILAGRPADIVIADTACSGKIDAGAMISRSHNTPFDGRTVRGRVYQTIVEGELRYDYGQTL